MASKQCTSPEAQGQPSSLNELLALLAPQATATEADEAHRASIILQHAAHGPRITDAQLAQCDEEAAEQLRALQILQGVLGDRAPGAAPVSSDLWLPENGLSDEDDLYQSSLPGIRQADSGAHHIAVQELEVPLPRLKMSLRLLEAADSQQATRSFKELGHDDPFGSKAWPSAYLVADRLLSEDLQGRSVLELGCGTGFVAIAALLGGARSVLATDRAKLNVDSAQRSAHLNGLDLQGQVFDVTSSESLPCRGGKAFDYVVFADVLYWPAEASAFGRRAAEAFAQGSTVIMADPGRRREQFLGELRSELALRLGSRPLPKIQPEPTEFPEHVWTWVSAEVRTASSLFCQAPFVLVLQQARHAKVHFEIVD
ncbi:Etfbkmt [Symbiodinium sp. CCMP2592]|nr:Etfbkmt [Symbiodinium sp. CCMP2592]